MRAHAVRAADLSYEISVRRCCLTKCSRVQLRFSVRAWREFTASDMPARYACRSMERARPDIAQRLQRVGCLRNEHRRRCPVKSQHVASATDSPGRIDGARAPRFRGLVCQDDCNRRPAVCGLMALGSAYNWLPPASRFAYALR